MVAQNLSFLPVPEKWPEMGLGAGDWGLGTGLEGVNRVPTHASLGAPGAAKVVWGTGNSRFHRWQGSRDERACGGKRRRAELRNRVVVAVEEVVDLGDDLQPACDAQVAAEIGDRIALSGTGPR